MAFECQEFRHRGQPEEFVIVLSFQEGARQRRGEIVAEVHATNLREPRRVKVAISREVQERDAIEDGRAALGLVGATSGV